MLFPALDFVAPRGDTPGREAPAGATSQWEPDMETLIARVAATAGAKPDVARKAVALVLDFIAREAPDDAVAALLAKAPELKAIIASSATTGGEGMGPMVRGLMGTGAGAMGGGGLLALGADLMALGFDMSQIQAIGKEVLEYAREQAGDDVIGEIAEAIPGLAQYL